MNDADGSTRPKTRKRPNPVRLASLGFLLVGLWLFGSALYSRCVVAPRLQAMAGDEARWDDARKEIRRATRLVFGRGLFSSRLTPAGGIPDCISAQPLSERAAELEKRLADEKQRAEKLALMPDPSAAARYGRPCADYVGELAALRLQSKGPSQADAAAKILGYAEAYVRSDLMRRTGHDAASLILTYHSLEGAGQMTKENRAELSRRWRTLVGQEIEDFRRIILRNGRNGYILGGFLFLVSAGFLALSLRGHGIIPQELLAAERSDES